MTDTVTGQSRWPRWIALAGYVLAIGAPLIALAMALATGAGWLGWQISLGALRNLSYAAMAGVGLSLIALAVALFRRRWLRSLVPVAAILIGGAFVLLLSYNFGKATVVPPIHDVTTDLTSPPEFSTLSLRADNREVVPAGEDPRLEPLDNAMRWRIYHIEAYGDIAPIVVPLSVPDTIAAAERLVEERGWDLAIADPATGRLEATDTVSLYRFKDDIVLRVTPNPNGAGSVVNMRSVSRVGVSDLGVNAERVRAFLRDLQAATGG